MRYAGGKGRSYQQLINLMPPHEVYVESHLGGGAVMRHKRPASRQIGIDIDSNVIDRFQMEAPGFCELICGDAVSVFDSLSVDQRTLIYVDPPYLPSTRRRAKVYRHDYLEADHVRLLEALVHLPCMVMISGYSSPLYTEVLSKWNVHRFKAKTHIDVREEVVWFNYPKPGTLFDTNFLGATYREREQIRRRQTRLRSKISALPPYELGALRQWLNEHAEGVAE